MVAESLQVQRTSPSLNRCFHSSPNIGLTAIRPSAAYTHFPGVCTVKFGTAKQQIGVQVNLSFAARENSDTSRQRITRSHPPSHYNRKRCTRWRHCSPAIAVPGGAESLLGRSAAVFLAAMGIRTVRQTAGKCLCHVEESNACCFALTVGVSHRLKRT